MCGENKGQDWCGSFEYALAHVGLSVVLSMYILGCEHRMSLTEFLEMEQEMRQEAAAQVPTSQPSVLSAEARAAIDRRLGPYKVGPSDVLAITLTGTDQAGMLPPVQTRVDRNGEIELPVVGAVKVVGMELEDVEDAIRNAYVPKVYQQVVVHAALVSPDTTDVLVVGAVTIPGLVKLRRTECNLLFAIVEAGGVSELASGQAKLRRIRRPGEEVTLDLTAPEELKAALALDPLEDGDIVTVTAATPNTIFVGGLVNAPRPQIFPQGVPVTVLQALAASGGLRTDVTPREATLIRRLPNGQDVHVKLDMDRITTGKDPNITLAAGDILWIPDTLETRVQDWVNRNIFIRAGATATFGANYDMQGIDYLNSRARQRYGQAAAQNLQDTFDPFGFLMQNQALRSLQTAGP